MIFEIITTKSLELAMNIVNSNPSYNVFENVRPTRTLQEVSSEFLNTSTESNLIKYDGKYLEVIDFLKNNHKNYPWIGLLMIHQIITPRGYGKKVYLGMERQ